MSQGPFWTLGAYSYNVENLVPIIFIHNGPFHSATYLTEKLCILLIVSRFFFKICLYFTLSHEGWENLPKIDLLQSDKIKIKIENQGQEENAVTQTVISDLQSVRSG